jgi:hypothetical protein
MQRLGTSGACKGFQHDGVRTLTGHAQRHGVTPYHGSAKHKRLEAGIGFSAQALLMFLTITKASYQNGGATFGRLSGNALTLIF